MARLGNQILGILGHSGKFATLIKSFLKSENSKNFMIYSSGAVILKASAFVLVPLYTVVFTPAEFGRYDLLNTVVQILSILFAFGLNQVVLMEFYHHDRQSLIQLLGKIFWIYLSLATIVLIICFFTLSYFSESIFGSRIAFYIICVCMLVAYLTFFQDSFFLVLQLSKRAKMYSIAKAAGGISAIVLTVVLVYYERVGIVGIFLANLIILVVLDSFAFVEFKRVSKKIFWKFSWTDAKGLLLLGLPFVPSAFAYWVLTGVDRWFLLRMKGQAEVGLYSIATKFVSVYQPLIILPVLGVLTPFFFERFAAGNYNMRVKNLLIVTVIVAIVLGMASRVAASVLVSQEFRSAINVIPYLAFGYGLNFLSQILAAPQVFHKKSWYLLQNVMVASASCILLNFFLVASLGVIGAALAFSLSNLAWLFSVLINNGRIKPSVRLAYKGADPD